MCNRLFRPTQLARDLLHPSLEEERRKHKKKRLVQSPNSYFMDVKCPGNGPRVARWARDELPRVLLGRGAGRADTGATHGRGPALPVRVGLLSQVLPMPACHTPRFWLTNIT